MKIQITFKDPDGVSDAVMDKAAADIAALDIPEDEADSLEQQRTEKIYVALENWIRHGEYLEVEFDTEAKTATVIPNR